MLFELLAVLGGAALAAAAISPQSRETVRAWPGLLGLVGSSMRSAAQAWP
jgi:hypothetical protein